MPKTIRKTFDKISASYDSERRQLIPCFDAFYRAAVSAAEAKTERPLILDLGAGTGILSNLLRNKYPQAVLTLMDVSENMLAQARIKLGENECTIYKASEYVSSKWGQAFDIIISALSIHHLPTKDKRMLYTKVFRHLSPGGCFINADQVRGATPYLDAVFKREWKQRIENSGLPKSKILASYERMRMDHEDTLDKQLKWLSKNGFVDVGCLFQWYGFAVMFAQKPTVV